MSSQVDREAAKACSLQHAHLSGLAIAAFAVVEAQGKSKNRSLRPCSEKVLRGLFDDRRLERLWTVRKKEEKGAVYLRGWVALLMRRAKKYGHDVPKEQFTAVEHWLSVREKQDWNDERAEAASSLLCRLVLGQTQRTHPNIGRDVRQILRNPPFAKPGKVDYQYLCLASFGLRELGSKQWRQWMPMVRPLFRKQVRGGKFANTFNPDGIECTGRGRVFSSALAAITLQIYYRYCQLID